MHSGGRIQTMHSVILIVFFFSAPKETFTVNFPIFWERTAKRIFFTNYRSVGAYKNQKQQQPTERVCDACKKWYRKVNIEAAPHTHFVCVCVSPSAVWLSRNANSVVFLKYLNTTYPIVNTWRTLFALFSTLFMPYTLFNISLKWSQRWNSISQIKMILLFSHVRICDWEKKKMR